MARSLKDLAQLGALRDRLAAETRERERAEAEQRERADAGAQVRRASSGTRSDPSRR